MGQKTIFFVVLLSTIFAFIFLFKFSSTNAAIDCLYLTASSPQEDKAYCRNELSQIEAQLQELLKKQEVQKKQTGTLKGDVDYLASQISALKTKIKARSLVIAQLKASITEKVSKISTLSEKIEEGQASLAQLLRNINGFDNENLVQLVLSDESLSGFYSNLESYDAIKKAVKDSVDEIRGIRTETEAEKKNLEEKQNAEADAKAELESAQKKVAQSEAEKKALLQISKQKSRSTSAWRTKRKPGRPKSAAPFFPWPALPRK